MTDKAAPSGSIAIIVAVYNGEDFLEEALQSAQAQTRAASEIIVVDDGSKDRSAEIARDCGATVISQANGGQAAARNAGIRASSSEYLVFLDHDDRLLKNNLAVNASYLDADPGLGYVGGRSVTIRADGARIEGAVNGPDSTVPCSYKTLMEGEAFVPPSSVMFRCTSVQEAGGFNAEMRSGNEELDLFFKIARRRTTLRHDIAIAEYRRHDSNHSSNSLGLLASVLELLEAQRPHCAGDAALLAAIETGKRHWAAIYGPALVGKAMGDLKQGKTRRALQGLALAARVHPQSYVRYAKKQLRRN
ncbi:MAG: glycosyltransferase family A protein [Pseudomonadota bacterium]